MTPAIGLAAALNVAPLCGQAAAAPFELISVTTGGTAGGGPVYVDELAFFTDYHPSVVSADNRYVVFPSGSDQLVAGDANGVQDVFVRDRLTGTTILASPGFATASGTPVLSAGGRYVAFVSRVGGRVHVFVRDLLANTTTLVTAGANQDSFSPSISADGRYVAFGSYADNLVPGDTNRFNSDVFVRDMVAGTTERVSLRPDGTEIVGASSASPSISADGRRIAFRVVNDRLGGPTPGLPPNLVAGIYVRDRAAATTALVSARPDGTPSAVVAYDQVISANGRYVSFSSRDDLDPSFPDADEETAFDGPFADVFVRDLETGVTERVSLPFPGGAAEESGDRGSISADGRYVVYNGDDGGVRVRDRIAGTTLLMTAPGGGLPDGPATARSISNDGRLVYLETEAGNLVANDTNGLLDVYLFSAAPSADLSLDLQANPPQPAIGANVTLTVTVVNGGPSDAAGIAAQVVLPGGLAYVSDDGGGTFDVATGVWTTGSLPAGSSVGLQVVGRFTAPAGVSVTAQVTAASVADPDSTPNNGNPAEDDQRTVVIAPPVADLAVGLSANTTTPSVQTHVVFTASVANAGPGNATGVAVRLPLPAGLTFVSAGPFAGYDPGTGVWTVGAVPSGGGAALTLVARVRTAAAIDVTAEVGASDQTDPDSTPRNGAAAEDDQATASLTPVAAPGIVVNDATTAVSNLDGKCTLIEAIVAANTDQPSGNALGECAGGDGADVILLRALNAPKDVAGIRDQYRLTSAQNLDNGPNGLPAITSPITIDGGGADVVRFGGPPFRLFYVSAAGQLTLNNLAVTSGALPAGVGWSAAGGAILNLGTLEVNDSFLGGNTAACDGGAIESNGPLTIRRSVLQLNRAGCSGGAVATFYAGQVSLVETTLQSNSAPNGSGGGLMVHGTTTATVTGGLIDSNTARVDGGGLLAHNADANVSLAGTRVTNNDVTAGHGGGVANGRVAPAFVGVLVPGGTMVITDSTVSNNRAIGGFGGGVVNAGSLSLKAGAVSDNQIGAGFCGGGLYNLGALSLEGSVVARNAAPAGPGGGICSPGPLAVANSTISANTTGSLGGGVALYHAASSTFVNTSVVGNTALAGGGIYSLRTALVLDKTLLGQNAAADEGGGAVFQGGATALINDSRVVGNTAGTAGGGLAFAFDGAPATLALTGGTVEGNTANGAWATHGGGGGIANLDPHPASTVTLTGVAVVDNRAPNGGNGGGIFNTGALNMTGGSLGRNTAQSGGGLSNGTSLMSGGPVTLNGVTVEDNVATSFGGGLFDANPPGAAVTHSLTLSGAAIRNNRAVSGGGISTRANSRVNVGPGTLVAGNTASAAGGGVNSEGVLTVNGATFTGNTADLGGALQTVGRTTLTASTIHGNTARAGAGIRLTAGLTDVDNSTLSGNVATLDGGGALDVTGTILPGGQIEGLTLTASTVVDNTGNPGGVRNAGYVLMASSILAGNRLPGGAFAECLLAPGALQFAYSGTSLLGQEAGCGLAAVPPGTLRFVDPATVLTSVVGPLAENGGPAPTHALRPGSLALDGGPAACPATDQRGEPRPLDGDGDGAAGCDLGAYEQQTPLPGPDAVLSALSPDGGPTGAGAPVITVIGTGFLAGSIGEWNGAPRFTFVPRPTLLVMVLQPGDVATAADFTTALVTVRNPDGGVSNPLPYAVFGPQVATAQSRIVPPGAADTASTAPTAPGRHGVTATLTNNGAAGGSATLTVATYSTNPAGGTIFAAGSFFDVQVLGADPSDSVAARFYYPSTVVGAVEAALQLQYWTGAVWAPVTGPGGALPAKDATDNLDGTVSGGRFAVTLDGSSTPRVTDLGGTVFALVSVEDIDDTTPPVTAAAPSPAANASGWNNSDVTVTLTAADDRSAIDRIELDLDGAGWTAYSAPIGITAEGVHTLQFRSRDAAGNLETARALTIRIDKTAPSLRVRVKPNVLWPANHRLVDVTADVEVRDRQSGSGGFTLLSVTSDEPADGRGDGSTPVDIVGWTEGIADTRGKLRAERSARGNGRVYTLRYRAVDRAGNATVATATVRVPR